MKITEIVNESLIYATTFNKLDSEQIYYTFSDVSIIPTFLSTKLSRSQTNTTEVFVNVRGGKIEIFPIMGASMTFMRSRFAKDIASEHGIHFLPRVGLTEAERLDDIKNSGVAVGAAVGVKDSTKFLETALSFKNLHFFSIDIAHGASIFTIEALDVLRKLGIKSGVIAGNVGSVEGFAFLYKAMDLMGFTNKIIKVGVGPGASCTTRVNTGVGVGQMTLLQLIWDFIKEQKLTDVSIISDGGINLPGEFVKALSKCNAVMAGRIFSSKSFEENVLIEKSGETYVKYYGMASAEAKKSNDYVEGTVTYQKINAEKSSDIVVRLRQGLESAMTYTNSTSLVEFRKNARFVINSAGSIVEAGSRSHI